MMCLASILQQVVSPNVELCYALSCSVEACREVRLRQVRPHHVAVERRCSMPLSSHDPFGA